MALVTMSEEHDEDDDDDHQEDVSMLMNTTLRMVRVAGGLRSVLLLGRGVKAAQARQLRRAAAEARGLAGRGAVVVLSGLRGILFPMCLGFSATPIAAAGRRARRRAFCVQEARRRANVGWQRPLLVRLGGERPPASGDDVVPSATFGRTAARVNDIPRVLP